MNFFRSPLLWTALLAGCTTSFEPASKVTDLRVLAVESSPPEVAPGDTVSLSALIADPSGVVVPPTVVWLVCFPDAVNGVDSCTNGTNPQAPVGFGVTEIDVPVPADVPLEPAGDPNAQTAVLLTLVACTSADPNECFACDDSGCTFGGEGVEAEVAIKRIIVSARPPELRNQNPELVDVFAAGPDGEFIRLDPEQPTSLDVCSGLTLRAQATPESAETFEEIQFGEPIEVTEQVVTSYFVTRGSVGSDRIFNGVGEGVEPGIADNRFSAGAGGTEPFHAFFVLRDDRGGTDFAARVIQPTAACN